VTASVYRRYAIVSDADLREATQKLNRERHRRYAGTMRGSARAAHAGERVGDDRYREISETWLSEELSGRGVVLPSD
jgi:hypothetical protein